MAISARRAALDILLRVEKDKSYSNFALDSALKKYTFDERDTAFITALVYGTLEHLPAIDYYIEFFAKRDRDKLSAVILNILRLGVEQLLFMDKIPESAAVNESVNLAKQMYQLRAAGLVNGVLREITRNRNNIPIPDKNNNYLGYLEVMYCCPKALITLWQDQYGNELTEGILKSLKTRSRETGRVNTLKTTAEALIEILRNEGSEAVISERINGCIEFLKAPNIKKLRSFEEGFFHLQDTASQFCCLTIGAKPGETVFDLCAAPGGKSFTIAQHMENKGVLKSFELHENRLKLIDSGASKLSINIIKTGANDASKENSDIGQADRVLCDVPCSGLGVIRRKPEIRYKNPDDFRRLPEVQYKILCEGARHVKPGGTLVYSTCTLNKAENDEVADKFLSEHPEFKGKPLPKPFGDGKKHVITLFPHINDTDGFFVAAFKKNGMLKDE